MGRSRSKQITCQGLIDTAAWGLMLPASWKERLGALTVTERVELVTADQRVVPGEMCGPVAIRISRFRPVFGEVVFSEMAAEDPEPPALIGYTVLEQSGIIVDLVGHRLVRVPHYDFKSAVC